MNFQKMGVGSSKELYASTEHPQHLFFKFSDRISVFDFGPLPDVIPYKGEALERSARCFFRVLEDAGIPTAYDRLLTEQVGQCALRAARHPKFHDESTARFELEFIPVEVIFRWGVVPGSSLLRRDPALKPFARFENPRIEFTTKLEAADRHLEGAELETLVGGGERLQLLQKFAQDTAVALERFLKSCGVLLWDGKIECAWDIRHQRVVMVDALTPDEMRITLPGLESVPLSKELLRQWINGTHWAFDVRTAKEKSSASGWQQQVKVPVPRLGPWRLERLSSLYLGMAQMLETRSAETLWNWAREEPQPPKVFIHGRGGREEALRWRLEKEGAQCTEHAAEADVVWVSPDADLAAGWVDRYEQQSAWAFGPRQSSARVESSKEFGKKIALKAGIPCAKFSTHLEELRSFSKPPVVKKDALAAGKGVVIPQSWEEAESVARKFSEEGPIVLEERLEGFEASAFFAVETGYYGARVSYLGSARDFKKRFQFDEGPNTGGMGAHAPHPQLTDSDLEVFQKWAESTAQVLMQEGLSYNGILYIGALKDRDRGWCLLEFNARFGDPETEALVCTWSEEPVLRRILGLDLRVLSRRVETPYAALCVALVRPEYPEKSSPAKEPLPVWDFVESEECVLFHNASGSGRVAFLVGRGPTLLEAGDQVFGRLIECPWKGHLDWRTDLMP